MRSTIILLLISLSLFACSKKSANHELKYTDEEFSHLAHLATAVSATGENAIPFSDYSPGVSKPNSKTLIYERLKFYAVQFETETQARNEAMRLNQYYSRNILFDRVEGEPILEDYIIKTFQGKNPNRTVQRAPKKEEGHPGEHSTEHSTEHGAPAPADSHGTHSTHQ